MKHALIETATGKVMNVIEIDPTANYAPPAGCSVLFNGLCINASPGDTWSGSSFTPGPGPIPASDQPAFEAAVNQLRSTFNTVRNANQINNSIDAITVILRRAFRDLT